METANDFYSCFMKFSCQNREEKNDKCHKKKTPKMCQFDSIFGLKNFLTKRVNLGYFSTNLLNRYQFIYMKIGNHDVRNMTKIQ